MPDHLLKLIVLDGLTLYEEAHTLQRGMVSSRVADEIPDTLILLQHPAVITLGQNASDSDITVKPRVLAKNNIAVHRVERGGQVTYHGPGQIVGYTIVDLLALKIGVEEFINRLEETMILACKEMKVEAYRKKGAPGVYTYRGKVGAIGVRVTRGVTFHGFSINVNPDLEHYKFIKPCGMSYADITSIEAITGSAPPLAEARRILTDCFAKVFGMTIQK
jgi:lipoyl(octanoyl) transferase